MREIRNKRCAMWRNHHRSQSEETDQVNVFLLGRNHMEMYKIMILWLKKEDPLLMFRSSTSLVLSSICK